MTVPILGRARIALIGLALALLVFANHAAATCVQDCIVDTLEQFGCDTFDQVKCMCGGGKSQEFLYGVMDCMGSDCIKDLNKVDDNFLDPVKSACKDQGKPIGKKVIKDAKEYAEELLEEADETKKTTTKTSVPTGKPKPTLSSAEDNEKTTSSTSSISESTPTTRLVVQTTADQAAPNTAAAVPPPPAPTTPTEEGSGNRGPVDDSPFGNPSGSGTQGLVAGASWKVLPLVAALLLSLQ